MYTHAYRSIAHNSYIMEVDYICPPAGEWTKKMWHIYTKEYYTDINDTFDPLVGKWVDSETIMVSE